MEDFYYTKGNPYIRLYYGKGFYEFKIDTGAFTTVLNKKEFKNFCPNKTLEHGIPEKMVVANGAVIDGFIHKVSVYIKEFKESRLLDIFFYDGSMGLLGMDAIKNNFKICFEKYNFKIELH
jgi:hypothetical protein